MKEYWLFQPNKEPITVSSGDGLLGISPLGTYAVRIHTNTWFRRVLDIHDSLTWNIASIGTVPKELQMKLLLLT